MAYLGKRPGAKLFQEQHKPVGPKVRVHCCSFRQEPTRPYRSAEASSAITAGTRRKAFPCSLPKFSSSDPANSDRKSTRLNSSHANISYAVFCLKKKRE